MQAERDTPLRRCEVRPDRLTIADLKTGPRHVLLGEAKREVDCRRYAERRARGDCTTCGKPCAAYIYLRYCNH